MKPPTLVRWLDEIERKEPSLIDTKRSYDSVVGTKKEARDGSI